MPPAPPAACYTHTLWKNAHRPPRHLSVVCDLRGDVKTCNNETSPSKQRSVRLSWPPRPSAPSPSAFASSPPARRSSATQAILDVTDANFQARRHLHGECLAHPWGCDCEKVQRPTLGHNEAWQLMAMRFKAALRRPALLAPSASGANAPLERQRGEPLSPRANALHAEVRERERRGGKSIEKVLSRHPAWSSTPAVLAVSTRVAQRPKPVGHDSRASTASGHGGARDVLRTSRARPSTTSSGVRTKVAPRLLCE